MRFDIWRYIGIFSLGLLLGLGTGYLLQSLLIVAIGIIAWQSYRLAQIIRWIENEKRNEMPELEGQFYYLQRAFLKRRKAHKDARRRLVAYVGQIRRAINALPDAIIIINRKGEIEWANDNAANLLDIDWPGDANIRLTNLLRNPQVEDLLANAPEIDDNDIDSMTGIEIRSPKDTNQFLNVKLIPYTANSSMVQIRDVSRLLRVNKMRNDFVANVSHELKTPLTVLRGYVEMLQQHNKLDSVLRKPVDQMAVQAVRMQSIVSDLLYLSKLEDADNLPELESIDVSHIVNSIVEAVQPLIVDRSHTIEMDIDSALSLDGNTKEIHSAFTNLISNAINYTPEHGVIQVYWREHKQAKVFGVKDNGLGIPATHLSRLTERFYRVDDNRSRERGGTGLGLAIVKHVLARHNATLEIESTVGEGSEFICVFEQARNAIDQGKDSEAA